MELSCTVVIMIIMSLQHKGEQRNSSALVEFCTRVSSVLVGCLEVVEALKVEIK